MTYLCQAGLYAICSKCGFALDVQDAVKDQCPECGPTVLDWFVHPDCDPQRIPEQKPGKKEKSK